MATLGTATDEQRKAHEAVLEVNAKMAEALRPGITCSELYRIGTEAVEAGAGDLKRFGPPRMGHGQGMLVTEPPSISPDDHTALEAGVVLSTEPGVSVGGVQLLWEDVHVITEDGHEQLTLESSELREISL